MGVMKMLNYETYENGSKFWIVFIHGIGGSTLTWRKQINDFSKNYNLLLIDLPGHGKSQNENEQVTIKNINGKIKEVLDYLSIKKADFVGMSLGTLVIANFTVKYPQYVNSIIFGGAVIKVDGFYKLCMHITNFAKNLLPHNFMYDAIAHIIMPRRRHKKSRNIFIRESKKMKRKSFQSWIKYMSEITHSQELLEKLKKLNIKMLFISGEEDIYFIDGAKKVANYLTKSSIRIIEKCGHVCTIEKAKEFNVYALNYLQYIHNTP